MADYVEHTNRPEHVALEERPPTSGGRSQQTEVSLGSGKTTAAAGGTAGHGGPGQGNPSLGGGSGK